MSPVTTARLSRYRSANSSSSSSNTALFPAAPFFPAALPRPLPCLRRSQRGKGSSNSPMAVHFSLNLRYQNAPGFCRFLSVFWTPAEDVFLLASPSLNPALSAKFTSSTGLQEGGSSRKQGQGCTSGSLRALSAAANGDGARSALPSMEREECCTELYRASEAQRERERLCNLLLLINVSLTRVQRRGLKCVLIIIYVFMILSIFILHFLTWKSKDMS